MSKEVHRIYFCKDGAILDTQIKEGEDVTDTLKRCFKKISDLEAKLAVSENTITNLVEDNRASQEWYKKQLAESEKTIEELKGERLKFYTDEVRRTQVINDVHFDMEQLLVFSEYVEHEKWVIAEQDKEINELKQQRQDKISFALEQLERLKYNIRLDNSDEETGDMPYVVDTTCLFELIDNQIEELTHQHEDKGE